MLPPKALFAAAALASSTVSALLLPPPIDIAGHTHHIDTADASDHDRPYHDGAALKMASAFSQHTAVKVACPGCAMSMRVPATRKGAAGGHEAVNDDHHGKTITMTGVPNHIPLFFSIDQDPERGHDVLLVNFFEIYPDVDVVGRPLHGLQIPDDHVHVPHGAVDAHHHKGDEHHHNNDDDNDDNDVLAQVKHRKNRKNRKTHDATSKTKQRHHRHHGKNHGLAVPVPLGYTLHTQTVGRDASNGMEVVALTLQIIEVDNVFVLGIPAVSMRLIRTPEGGLMIAHVDVAATDVAETMPALPSAENNNNDNNGDDRAAALRKQLNACTNVLCRWRAIAAANLRSHGGCGRSSTSKAAPNTVPHRGHHWEADYHQRHHHNDGDNSGRPLLEHSWTQLLRMFTAHILFPILIGIAGGIFVSLVGMFVGTLLVRFWRLVFRRGRRDNDGSSSSHAHTHGRRHRHHSRRHSMSKEALQEQGGDEEKASLMAADAAAIVAEDQPAADELPPYHDEAPKTDA